MQKLLKIKSNYKKFLADKELSNKYDYKNSQTFSTNQSKIHNEYEKQSLTNFFPIDTYSVMQKNLNRYGTSNEIFYLTAFETMYSQNRTRQKILLNDLCSFKDEELMQKLYSSKKSVAELRQLFEYYKYYINNPTIFGKDYFKTLYNFYQKKKYLQYKKLKAVLDLDDDRDSMSDNSMSDNISVDPKKSTKENSKTFYIMDLIQTELSDKNNQCESQAFLQLNSNLEEILEKMNNPYISTPQKSNLPDSNEKNSILFKKKKTLIPSNPSSFKNNPIKKTKKLSFQNSNSSLKKMKFTKTVKQPYLSKFHLQPIQFASMKIKCQIRQRKFRHASNLSMGELDAKSNNLNNSSPKKYIKKRLNSCQTIISRNCCKQKLVHEKKIKYKAPAETKSKEQKNQMIELRDFENYLKRVSMNFRKSVQKPAEKVIEKGAESGISFNISKFRGQNSPQKVQGDILMKKLKKKVPTKNISAKNSVQKSLHHSTGKQQLIEESIINLKKKIRLAKETIKCTNSNSTSNLHTQKNSKV